MIIVGLVLLTLGFVLAIKILWILGVVALACGIALALAGVAGRGIGGRQHYW